MLELACGGSLTIMASPSSYPPKRLEQVNNLMAEAKVLTEWYIINCPSLISSVVRQIEGLGVFGRRRWGRGGGICKAGCWTAHQGNLSFMISSNLSLSTHQTVLQMSQHRNCTWNTHYNTIVHSNNANW